MNVSISREGQIAMLKGRFDDETNTLFKLYRKHEEVMQEKEEVANRIIACVMSRCLILEALRKAER